MRYLFGLLCLINLGCSSFEEDSTLSAYVSKADDRWDQVSERQAIRVCFMQAGYDLDKDAIRTVVSQEFVKADIHFEGWGLCESSKDLGIKVKFVDGDTSTVSSVGKGLAGPSELISFAMSAPCPVSISGSHCQKNTALHEFGHGLGLRHEMNREDADCKWDQTGGLGESGAIKIGLYDKESIMNYCRMDLAEKRGETLSLSEGDVKALKSRYKNPTASFIKSPPRTHSRNSFLAEVAGLDTEQYRYQITSESLDTCLVEDNYSAPRPISSPLGAEDLMHINKGDQYKICLLGGDSQGNWQPVDLFSSYFRTLLNEEDQEGPSLQGLALAPKTEERLFFHMSFDDESEIKNISLTLRHMASNKLFYSFGSGRFTRNHKGRFLVPFKREKLILSGTYILEEIKVEDINGNRSTFTNQKGFYRGSNIRTLKLIQESGFKYESSAPIVRDIHLESISREVIYIKIFIEDESPIDFDKASLSFQHVHSNGQRFTHNPVIEAENLGDNIWRLKVNAPQTQGVWTLANIKVVDKLSNARVLELDPNKPLFYSNSSVEVLKIDQAHGFAAPRLEDLSLSKYSIRSTEDVIAQLKISSGSNIQYIAVYYSGWDRPFKKFVGREYSPEFEDGVYQIKLSSESKKEIEGTYVLDQIVIKDHLGVDVRYLYDQEQGLIKGTDLSPSLLRVIL